MAQPYGAIVIGGGLAGATAARELAHRGHRPLVLEARDRLGGRGWTTDFEGTTVDMGGQNVHWTTPFVWSEIHRYGLEIREVEPFGDYVVTGAGGRRQIPAAEAGRHLAEGFQAYLADHGKIISRPYDPGHDLDAIRAIDHMTMGDRCDQLDLSPVADEWLRSWLTMRCGGSLSTGAHSWILKYYASVGYQWPMMLEVASRFRLVDGIGALIKLVLADAKADVLLESPVKEITDDGKAVHVVTEDGRDFSAPVAVVATSANLWQHIDFTSGLSDAKLSASREGMQTPNLTKIWALVKGEVDNVYVLGTDPGDPLIHARKDVERPDGTVQLLGFSNDPGLDPTDHERIAQLFQEKIPLPKGEIIAVKAQDWVADPWTRGGTSLLRPGQMSRLPEIREPEGRIAFAGADIANGVPGFDGAVETGLFAARRAHEIAAKKTTEAV